MAPRGFTGHALDDHTGPEDGIEIELWEAPDELVHRLALDVQPPLEIAPLRLSDGSTVTGFTANSSVRHALDISAAGSWRRHIAERAKTDPE